MTTTAAEPCFNSRRLGHVNITASSTPRLSAYYADVLGLEHVFQVTDLGAAFFSNGNTHHDVALVQSHDTRPVGLGHLGIELETEHDLLTGIASFDERGIEPVMLYNHQISVSAYLRDPSGHLVEFYWDQLSDWRGFFTEHWGGRIGSLWTEVTPLDAARPGHHYADDPELRTPPPGTAGVSWILAAGLGVTDLGAAVDFYSQIAGMSVLHRTSDSALLGGTFGKPDLALMAAPEAKFRSTLYVAAPGRSHDEVAAGLERGGSPIRRAGPAVVGADPDGTLVAILDPDHPINDVELVLDLLAGR